MNPLLLDIIEYFTALGLVQGDGIDCFRDFSPEKPDNVIVVYEYQGLEVKQYTGVAHRSVQITVRDLVANTARVKALELFNALVTDDTANRIDFTADRWGQVTLRSTPYKIKIDENSRTVYGFEIGITTNYN